MSFNLILFSFLAGVTIFLGGLLALLFKHHESDSDSQKILLHIVTAFGGGILLSAVALVLVPRGMEGLSTFKVVIFFSLGAFSFALLDKYLSQKGGKVGTVLAMLMDFIPESLALGATFSVDPNTSILLAIFIGLQNLPESFNSFRDLVISGFSVSVTLTLFFFLSFFGVISATLGHYYLTQSPEVTSSMMIFSSSGILFLLFKDIAPEINYKNYSLPVIALTFGFLIGVIGEKVL